MRVFRGCALALAGAITWLELNGAAQGYEVASKWTQATLGAPVELSFSYSNLLDGGLAGLTPDELRAATIEGLQLWSAVAPLELSEVDDSGPPPTTTNYPAADHPKIRIGYSTFTQGNVIARSYFPSLTGLAGDVHFNSRFTWSLNTGYIGSVYTLDLIEVATHELGHALGLDHVDEGPSIMLPTHQRLFSGLTTGYLMPDDIAGMQANYGAGFGYVLDRSGRLYLSGTEGGNAIDVEQQSGQILGASAGFGSFVRDAAGVTAVEINARGGADEIAIDGLGEQIADVRLLYGSASVGSGVVIHDGSASDVDAYRWSNSEIRLKAGSLAVRGNESGGVGAGSANFIQSGGAHAVGGTLRIGDTAGRATYTMQGGTLDLGTNGSASDALVIGQAGEGTFTQTAGVVTIHHGGVKLGAEGGSSGVYNLEGGVLDLMGNNVMRGAGSASFTLNGGALKNVAMLDGDLHQQAGTLSAGGSPGIMTVTGDYTLGAGGSIEVELVGAGGVPGVDHDYYNVLGDVALNGTLDVKLLGEFIPELGDVFDILDWSGVSGRFSALQLPALAESLRWDTSRLYTAGSLMVTAAGAMPGDLDDDGQVGPGDIDALWAVVRGIEADDPNGDDEEDLNGDGALNEKDVDFLLSQLVGPQAARRYGDADLDAEVSGLDFDAWKSRAEPSWASGDFDGDGEVGGLDFTLWRIRPSEFPWEVGVRADDAGSPEIVPEPSSWSLALCALLSGRFFSGRARYSPGKST